MLLSCRAGGARDGSGDVHVQRPTSSRSTSSRASRCSRCCASGSAWSRSKDGCAPQGQCGCCTVLVDGDAEGRVRHRRRRASRAVSVTTVEGLDAAVRDRLRVGVRRDRRIAVRVLHARGSSCAPSAGRRPALDRGAGRAPVPLHRLAHGVRRASTTRHGRACRRAIWPRPRTRRDARGRRRTSASSPTCRSAVAGSPTTPRRATRSSRYRCPRVRTPTSSKRPGCVGSSATSLEAARAAAGKVQGRRTTVDVRAAVADAADCPDGGVRLATSWVEPAYLEPDASWCEPGGEPASPLANGGAFGGKEHSRRARRRARARRRSSVARCASSTRAKTSCASARSARRSRRPRSGATVGCEIEGMSLRVWCPRRSPRAVRRRGRTRAGARSRCRVRRSAASCARSGSRSRRCSSKARSTRPASTVPRSPTTRRCSTRSSSRRREHAPVRVSRSTARPDDSSVSRCASRPAIRSTRSCCAPTRSARRTWRSGWVLTESIAVDPDTGEVHDLTIRSFGIIRARDMPPVVDHDPRRRRVRRARGRPTRCSRRSPRRPGTRSPASKASGPIRSRRATPAASDAPEVVDARRTRPDTECAARRRPVLARGARRRLARARRPGRPRSRDGQAWPTASKRRRARCSPTSRPCSATAARRCTDVAKTTVFVTDIARLRDRERASTPRRSATTGPRARPCRSPRCPRGAHVEIEAWAYLGR